jgi:hypothetical protein
MNWFKENPVVLAIAAIALVGTLVAGFFAMEAAVRQEQAVAGYTSAITNLRRLEGKQPFPDDAHLKEVQANVEAYKKSITDFVTSLNKMEVPVAEISPQKFQDDLRVAADNLRKATANKTALPENFFFGFDAFRTQLPPRGETQKLNREFLAIKSLIDAIVPLGITSIDTLVRHAGAAPAAPDPKAAPPKPNEAVAKPLPFDSFTLGITAPQNSFISAFDKIPANPGFLVVRSMTIENTSPTAPLKADTGKPKPATAPAPTSPGASEQLPMIFGSELVKATVVFEILDFPEQKKVEEKKPQPPTQPTPAQ